MKRLVLLATILVIMAFSLYGCGGKNTSINDEIGNLVKIDVYVNDVKVDTPVHKNNKETGYIGAYNLGDYVLLKPVCEVIGATYEVKDDYIVIMHNNEAFKVEKSFIDQSRFWIIDGNVYIQFRSIRYAIDGSLKQDGNKGIYLYTKDYIRLDIPATLDECYKALDKELDFLTKQLIKNTKVENLGIHHFGTGLWIRNNWIYPGNNRIDKVFRDAGIYEPDEMSYEIIKGYHHYLNGLPYEIGTSKTT